MGQADLRPLCVAAQAKHQILPGQVGRIQGPNLLNRKFCLPVNASRYEHFRPSRRLSSLLVAAHSRAASYRRQR
jgi:hypothetical protein